MALWFVFIPKSSFGVPDWSVSWLQVKAGVFLTTSKVIKVKVLTSLFLLLFLNCDVVLLVPSAACGARRSQRSASVAPPHRVSDCLRHGNSSDARAVRAVCLLMGGAAASSALSYISSCSPSSPLATRATEITHGSGAFSELSTGGAFHACSQDVDSPHFNSFDFEADSDFDAFDCGGFAF